VAKITGPFTKVAESTRIDSPETSFPATFSFDPLTAAAGLGFCGAGFVWADISFVASPTNANKTNKINDLDCKKEDLQRCNISMGLDYQN
jgi:hypothetical protein